MSGGKLISLEVNVEVSKTMAESKVTTDEVVELLRQLPPRERLQAVVRVFPHLEWMRPSPSPEPRQSLRGLWRGVNITDADIEEVRREMWAKFPAEDL
jgi:hypothetical protein